MGPLHKKKNESANDKKCVVFIPSRIEYQFVSKALQELYPENSTANNIELIIAGVGKKAAYSIRKHTDNLQMQNSFVLLTGTAGALAMEFNSGDVFLPDKIIAAHAEKEFFAFNARSIQSVLSFKIGTMITISKPFFEKYDKDTLRTRYNAVAVDMESFFVLKACRQFRLPVLIIKVIFDEETESISMEEKGLSLYARESSPYSTEKKQKQFIERLIKTSTVIAQVIYSICIQNWNVLESYEYKISNDAR